MKSCLLTILFLLLYVNSFSQNSCNQAKPFCANYGEITFPASVNTTAQVGPDYGCLLIQPNPAWYYFQVSNSGSVIIDISGTGGHDVDFICWGPFSSPVGNCNNLTSLKIVDCSYSSSPSETCSISGAVSGKYYMLLITNFSGEAQDITFDQTGGTGSTNCQIVNNSVTSSTICPNISTTINANTNFTNPTFSWSTGATSSSITVSPSITTVYSVAISGFNSVGNFTNTIKTGTVTVKALHTFTITPPAQLNCTLTQVDVVASNVSNATYSWTGLGITSSSNTESITVNQAGTYSCVVTTTNGCSSSQVVTVTQDSGIPSFTITLPAQLNCSLTQVDVVASNVSNATYSWTGLGITSSSNTESMTVNQAGTYSCVVTTTNGCSSSQVVTVTQDANTPSFSIGSPPQLNCSVAQVTLVASNVANATYSWTGLGITSNSNTESITVNQAGTYSCAVTTTNGCSSSQVVTVTQDSGIPSFTITPPAQLNCTLTQVDVVASNVSNATYSWIGVGILSGSATESITVNQAGTYSCVVTTTNGCTASQVVSVTQNNSFVANLLLSNLSCGVYSISAQASTTPSYSTTIFNIDFGDGNISTNAITSNTYVTAGIFSITLTAQTANCTATLSVPVTIISNPTIAITTTTNNLCIGQQTVALTAYGNLQDFQWIETITSTTVGNGQSVIVSPTVNTTYSIIATDANNCVASSTVSISVKPLPIITTTGAEVCANQATIDLVANGATTYTWVTFNNVNGNNIIVNTPSSHATYTVLGTDNNGCVGFTTATIKINPLPQPYFNVANTCINAQPIVFDASSTLISVGSNTLYLWDFGD